MTTNKYPRGSEWRKWDLHLHTASSYDYKYSGNDADEKLIDTLKNNGIAVVAITDHFVIDKEKINKLRNLASSKSYDLTIFPGVELRTDKGGSNIHPIIIFDNNINLDTLTEDYNWFKRNKANGKESNDTIRWDFNDIVEFSNNHNGILTIHAGSKKNGIDEQISNVLPVKISTKDEYAQKVQILEIGKIEDIDEYKTYRNSRIGIKPFIMGSDNHNPNHYPNEHNTSLFTWIKADPTFEGLKQILYEPESRVKIQEKNPEYEIEKCPFTYLRIPNKTKVFSEDEDIAFAPATLPLNNSLVSIIGGRGTGKSQLINYLASAFNRDYFNNKYNHFTDIEIGRKASLIERDKVFRVSEEPNASFVFIAQSKIKELVEKKEKLSRNILETIGVPDEYKKTAEYSQKVDDLINEYDRINKVLNFEGKTLEERKDTIQKEIKRYNDLISNITSEQNKAKLKDYKEKVEKLHSLEGLQSRVNEQWAKNDVFITELNKTIEAWNNELNSSIPLATIGATQDYLKNILLPRLCSDYQDTKRSIENTKEEFKEYKGDLSALLQNVSLFQNRVSELTKELDEVLQEESKYETLSKDLFRHLGETIKASIESYIKYVSEKWRMFKGDNEEPETSKKKLLGVILKEGMDVEATVSIDINKMIELLQKGLDGRKYNDEKLQKILQIKTIDNYYNFICQNGGLGAFGDNIREDLRRRLLTVFYKDYTEFICVGVRVTLNGRPISKLSYGQQGTVYLRLQLAANLFSETIIYDQPEDDLDNEFITNELISIFRTLKKYRQIIIVSHNANLVVNSDSEQIIVAKNDDGLLSYVSGALEDPSINSEVCRVLEGGKKAFEDRERKYRLA